jgi:hypothetical protein
MHITILYAQNIALNYTGRLPDIGYGTAFEIAGIVYRHHYSAIFGGRLQYNYNGLGCY